MRTPLRYSMICFLFISLLGGCSKNDDPHSEIRAVINGEPVSFKADKAKVYAGTSGALTIFGTNCSNGKKAIRLDLPKSVGTYDLYDLAGASYYINAAFACPGENGTSTIRIVREAKVIIMELSQDHIQGTFTLMAGNPSIDDIDIITEGFFDVSIE